MAAKILDGKSIAAEVLVQVAQRVEQLAKSGVKPGLGVILAGNDPASEIYVRNKARACAKVGIHSSVIRLERDTTQEELIHQIRLLNFDTGIHGILVQLPLPAGLDADDAIAAVQPCKDVDGFHVENIGKLVANVPGTIPCTPRGIMELIDRTGIDLVGKHAVVVGRSDIVGKPIAQLLLRRDCTVTLCHSKTVDLAHWTTQADVLIAAAGCSKLITADMVKPGAVVIDVGMNRTEEKLCGDVDFEAVRDVAGWITPVPGGVGPMTIAMLMMNTVEAAERVQHG